MERKYDETFNHIKRIRTKMNFLEEQLKVTKAQIKERASNREAIDKGCGIMKELADIRKSLESPKEKDCNVSHVLPDKPSPKADFPKDS